MDNSDNDERIKVDIIACGENIVVTYTDEECSRADRFVT
jgi:hypothetical protein